MGRVYRERKRRRQSRLHLQAVNDDPIYVDISKALHRAGWRNETELKVAEFAVTGRGVYSTRNICGNDTIISLPIASMISIVTMEHDDGFRKLISAAFAEKNRVVMAQSLLAIYLLYLKHHRRRMEYIRTVPNAFTVPYFCHPMEQKTLIRSIAEKVVEQKKIIQTDFANFKYCFDGSHCSCCNRIYFCDIFSMEEFEWAYFVVNSRSVYFSPDIATKMLHHIELRKWLKDEPTLALAPFLDLLNHNCDAKTKVQFKVTSEQCGQYELCTDVAFPKYQQIFISYGALDNIKLLTDYGFFLPNNPNDSIEFNATDPCIDRLLKRLPYKLRMFVKQRDFHKSLFIARVTGFSHNLKLLIHIVANVNKGKTFDDIELKKFVYNASDALDTIHDSTEWQSCASHLVTVKIDEMNASLNELNKLRRTHELTEQSTIYCDYLQDSINWLMANLHIS